MPLGTSFQMYFIAGLDSADFLKWLAEGVVKQHRTIGTYISIFLDAGFTLSAIDEWGPSAELIKGKPSRVENLERPIFFLMKATKPT
jgi:hypothetical protein